MRTSRFLIWAVANAFLLRTAMKSLWEELPISPGDAHEVFAVAFVILALWLAAAWWSYTRWVRGIPVAKRIADAVPTAQELEPLASGQAQPATPDQAACPEAGAQRLGCLPGCLVLLAMGSALLVWTVLFNPGLPSESHPGKRSRARNAGNLGAIQSALSLYYGKHDGQYPERLESLVEEKLMDSLPRAETIEHGQKTEVVIYGAETCVGGMIDGKGLRDSGGWGYISAPGSPCHGAVFVDCIHPKPSGRGSIWADERTDKPWFSGDWR